MVFREGSDQSQINSEFDSLSLIAAAHELKSPLVLMRQLALQLEQDHSPEAAHRLRLTAERSLRLTEQLTRTARLDEGLFDLEPLNLVHIAEEVAQELTPLARALNQTLVVSPNQAPLVLGNRELLKAVVFNLCDNALQHNVKGNNVTLSAVKTGQRATLKVRDFGASLPLASFRRLKHTIGAPQPLPDRPRSSGLGLMIAERCAQAMQAELRLRRHRNAGMTFSISLPRSLQLSLLDV